MKNLKCKIMGIFVAQELIKNTKLLCCEIQVNKKVRHNSKKHENNETMDVCRHPHTMRHNDNGL